jgi:hypothetical protein
MLLCTTSDGLMTIKDLQNQGVMIHYHKIMIQKFEVSIIKIYLLGNSQKHQQYHWRVTINEFPSNMLFIALQPTINSTIVISVGALTIVTIMHTSKNFC